MDRDIRSLTGLRGIAAAHVMMFHYFEGQPLSNPVTSILGHGYLAVDLFFILSGFVMALNYGPMFQCGWSWSSYLKFIGRRIARVYPLYAFMTLVACALILIAIQQKPPVDPVLKLVTINLLMVQSWGLAVSLDGPAWSISAEWAAYLLFPIILVPCLFRSARLAWVSAFGSVAVIAVLCLLPAHWAPKPYPNMLLDIHDSSMGLAVVRCLSEFALGVLLFRASRAQTGFGWARHRSVAPVICAATVALLATPKADFGIVLLFALLILSLALDGRAPGNILATRPIVFLGELSYSIYLTHDLMSGPMGWVRGSVEGMGWLYKQTYAAAAVVVTTLAVSYFCFRYVERPSRSWLRQVFEGGRPSHLLAR